MKLKDILHFTYGLLMGTSVKYVKPKKRFLWPLEEVNLDGDQLFVGGSFNSILVANRVLVGVGAPEQMQVIADRISASALDAVVFTQAPTEFHLRGLDQLTAKTLIAPRVQDRLDLFGHLGAKLILVDKAGQHSFRLDDHEEIGIVLLPGGQAHQELIVFNSKKKWLFLGGLFFNEIHPLLEPGVRHRVNAWVESLHFVLNQFSAERFIPAEGPVADREGVENFIRYLKTLSDPNFDFRYCREHFDWREIPGTTSLEENFELIRHGSETHAQI